MNEIFSMRLSVLVTKDCVDYFESFFVMASLSLKFNFFITIVFLFVYACPFYSGFKLFSIVGFPVFKYAICFAQYLGTEIIT